MMLAAMLDSVLVAWVTTPGKLAGWQHMLLLIPVCLGISIVYKTLRCEKLREVPVAALALCATIVLSMSAVGVGVWLLYLILA